MAAYVVGDVPAARIESLLTVAIERFAVEKSRREALREAKLHTRWTAPDAPYENAARRVLDDLVDSPDGRELLREIGDFARQLASAGLINSLAQTLLRNTLPGVPDLYQGTELWDFSLVDPDNRRPVDYGERAALLARAASEGAIDTRAAAWRSGAVKQALIQRTLALRARHPALLREGALIPVEIQGPRAPHLLAFLRQHARQALLVIVPRHCATAIAGYACDDAATARAYWADTRVLLPSGIEGGLLEIVSDRRYQTATLDIADLLRDAPVALCLMQDTGADRVPTASRAPPSV